MKTPRNPSGPLIVALASIAISGCASTADVAKREKSVCEIHEIVMEVKEVPVAQGTSVYLTEYSRAWLSTFPHHGGTHFSEDHGYLAATRLRIHVCTQFDQAYTAWRTAKEKQTPDQPPHHPPPARSDVAIGGTMPR